MAVMNWHEHVIKFKGAKYYSAHHRNIRQTDKQKQHNHQEIPYDLKQ